ncbi:non-ribosomal peptide synthetase [Paenibacillus sp. UMB4589-SE434]|uniref:non-ribosomal peptide synthetase n=1 Tax=Paenibacillus sp. UMB4589-SE434 TaxID=3046314 RepID=UPI002549C71C|nr:non-ribosomal peptide synthetase [Paenibacillus sp. UMB4589-SE434]MDK8180493.1 amino acid adenylation domain-containing protein [Paenibacillus sp. UMB4589-SE434]
MSHTAHLAPEPIVLHELTHPQKRIWYIENIYPSIPIHNIGGTIRIKGHVDLDVLEAAIRHVIQQHDGLRIRLREVDHVIYQYVSTVPEERLNFVDFSGSSDPEASYQLWLSEQARTPFQLTESPLYDLKLFRISDGESGYLIKLHHIIADGWSTQIMTEQIYDAYNKFSNGENSESAAAPSYLDVIDSERNYLQSERYNKNRHFWINKFTPLPDVNMSYGTDHIVGTRITHTLDPLTSARMQSFTAIHKTSLNTLFVMLYLLFMYKTTNQQEIVIGTPVLNRSGRKEKRTIGMFTSTMPFAYQIDGNRSAIDMLTHMGKQLIECYFHQKYPYDLLVQDLELKRQGFDQLFHVCVNYYNSKHVNDWNGCPVVNEEFYNGYQLYAKQLVIKEWSDTGCITLDVDYKPTDYDEQYVSMMINGMMSMSEQIMSHPERPLDELSLLSEQQYQQQIIRFNDTKVPYPEQTTITRLFEEQVERTPHDIAVKFKGEQCSYQQLNEKSNQLARVLHAKGVRSGSIVGLYTEHGMESIIGILAIMKAGGAYLPLDPKHPEERIAYMLADTRAAVLLTNTNLFADIGYVGEVIDLRQASLYRGDASNLANGSDPSDLAYIIYTSGSTGTPKGTMIEHRGLVNYSWWAKETYMKNERAVFPLYSSLAFDLTITSIFTPLIGGGLVTIYRDDEDEFVLFRILADNEATVIKLTPAHLSLLQERRYPNSSVKRFIVGGEDLKTSLASQVEDCFDHEIEIYNEYGPTETVVGCMIHQYDRTELTLSVPIGVPADNVMIYILDAHLNPLPCYGIGELYISGHGVARGYWNQPELSAARFIDNPFHPEYRMYRTGDLAFMREDGSIIYMGRIDHQVKIRGYRIELGEIVHALTSMTAIKESVVIDRTRDNGEVYLCAYIIKQESITEHEIRVILKQSLPDYMIPAYFVELDSIPLTANGKVDRKQLPEPLVAKIASDRIERSIPIDGLEAIFMATVEQVLNQYSLSWQDHFFYLGGDSIKAIQLASKFKSIGYQLKVKDILSNPVLIEMVKQVRQLHDEIKIDQSPRTGTIGATPIITWFRELALQHPNHYTQSVLLQLKQDVSTERLTEMLNVLFYHHDSLRIYVRAEDQQLAYMEHAEYADRTISIGKTDLTGYSAEEQRKRLESTGCQLKSEMDIHRGMMFKAHLFDLGEQGIRLLLIGHHLVVDGVSWRILLEDLVQLLEQSVLDYGKINLPDKTSSYQDWSGYMTRLEAEARKEQAYWEAVIHDPPVIPVQDSTKGAVLATSHTHHHVFDKSITANLLRDANKAYRTEPKDLLITALALTIFHKFELDEVVLELEGHGRELLDSSLDLSRTVGWFTSIYPVRIQNNTGPITHKIKTIKELLRSIPYNGIGYGVLRYYTKTLKDTRLQPPIRFNYLGDVDTTFNNDWFCMAHEPSGSESDLRNVMTALLDVQAIVIDQQLHVEVVCSHMHFNESEGKELVAMYVDELSQLVNHCCSKTDQDYTPSDFDAVQITQDDLDELFN